MRLAALETRVRDTGKLAMAYPSSGPVRPILATLRKTKGGTWVQFTYLGKRISRDHARELLEP
jgi:hypothetical protein